MSQLIVRQDDPFNAGPPLELLCQSEITPVDMFFVRNHGEVPQIDPATYRFTIHGLGPRPWVLTLQDLQERFATITLEATLQCAGNRRQELIMLKPIPDELEWGAEAIGNATWRGVRLRDVLIAAGIDEDDRGQHVAFEGFDRIGHTDRIFNFGGSIPIEKALHPEVVLAYEMNDAPLTPLHGFPLRVVVPGYIGARSVKWLSRICVRAAPSPNYFQAHAYRLFAPGVTPETADWDSGLMLGEMPVNAVITSPQPGETLAAGSIEVRGYAIAGGNRRVARVDLSVNAGQSWMAVDLSGDDRPWAWRLWQSRLDLQPGVYQVVVRAIDSAANTQPEAIASVWNFKGYMNNAWHRLQIKVF